LVEATIFLHNFHFIIAHNPKCHLFLQVLVEVFSISLHLPAVIYMFRMWEGEGRREERVRRRKGKRVTTTIAMPNTEIYGHLGNFTLFQLWSAALNAYMLI